MSYYSREQYRAWKAVYRAIARGDIVPPDGCQAEGCGKAPGVNKRGRSLLEAHHYLGYDHPLDVIFLCASCHKKEDAKIRKQREAAERRARLEATQSGRDVLSMVERLQRLKEARDGQARVDLG